MGLRMIDPHAFRTYAQYHEDIILLALLSDVEEGFYIDVGANYPTVDSVTKLFYERGWKGINIEPIPSLFKQLKEQRPDDINLQLGIGDKHAELTFYENENIPGHSSFKSSPQGGSGGKIKSYKVPILTLEEVFDTHAASTQVHFLKIDVEGFEKEVIAGANWSKYRPEVICVESNHRLDSWQDILLTNNYKLFINDGLNEYYVARESWARVEGFADKVVKLSYAALRQHQYDSWMEDTKQLKKLTKLNAIHYDMVKQLETENKKLTAENHLTLYGQTIRERLKRSLYGLTVDWIRYKRQ